MTLNRNHIRKGLQELEISQGGYYGTDLSELANGLNVTLRGLRKQLSKWKKHDLSFRQFTYLGKRKPTITLDEFIEIELRRQKRPLEVKKHLLTDMQESRSLEGTAQISVPTFYRRTKQIELARFQETAFRWFTEQGLTLPEDYSVRTERKKLTELFHYYNLQTPQGPNLGAVCERFIAAKEWYDRYQAEPMQYYHTILTLGTNLRDLLTSIPSIQQEEIQAKIIFKIQSAFIVECKDFLISKIIQSRGRIQQSMNASRQKVQNTVREAELATIRNKAKKIHPAVEKEVEGFISILTPSIEEEERATLELYRQKKGDYQHLLSILNEFTQTMTEKVAIHTKTAERGERIERILKLACDQKEWRGWTEEEKSSFITEPSLVQAINQGNWDVAQLKAIDRIITYIKDGKITFKESYLYQDISDRLKDVKLTDEDEVFLTSEVLEKLIKGTFEVDIGPLEEVISYSVGECDESEDEFLPDSASDLSDVLLFISKYVREHTPNWFSEHVRVFREQTEGMFSMKYTEEEFAERLYASIGYLGRNARYRESQDILNLRYFIQRYVSIATLNLELRFLHQCFTNLSSCEIAAFITDTIGIVYRKRDVRAGYHGRYHTIGFSDHRAVSTNMNPLHSSSCSPTDSEAMNMVAVIAEVQQVTGGTVKIYTGDAHTVSRVSAGMVYLSHGVIAAGRIVHVPKYRLTKKEVDAFRTHLPLLNRVGKLLRMEPSLGRVFAKKKHVFIDGVNVRKLIEEFGYLLLWNVARYPVPVNEVCNAVELSNYIKKVTRVLGGSYTRVDLDRADLFLKSAELVISICGLYHVVNNWKGPRSPFNLSDIRLFIPA